MTFINGENLETTGNAARKDSPQPTECIEACPACGSSERTLIVADAHDLLTSSPAAFFQVWRCLSCSSAYLSPRPTRESLGQFYPDDQYYPIGQSTEDGSRLIAVIKQRLRSLLSLPYSVRFGSPASTIHPFGQSRMLEIGFGHGTYLKAMRRLGWDVYGCDISRQKVEQLKSEFGDDRIFLGTLEDIHFEPESFDLIALWHVIEHLHEPGAILDRIFALLKPGGRLIIGTPNSKCLEERCFGRWWIGFEVPRHLIVFSQEALVKQLIAYGFEVLKVRPSLWSYSVPDSLALWINGQFGKRIWGGRVHLCLHHLLFPWAALSRTLGNWAILEVSAQKPGREDL